MKKSKYLKRLVENEIKIILKSSGAILISGPRFCGKTTTSKLFTKSDISLSTQDQINTIKLNPKLALIGDKPRLIDEWQTVPDIWNQIKKDLDENYIFGKYIITGSSTPIDKSKIHHSGIGRIANIQMKTMSLFESEESNGQISLLSLFNNKVKITNIKSNASLEDIAYYICRGGWPLAINVKNDRDIALQITKNYWNNLFVFENFSNEKFRNKDVMIFKSILRSYARNISTECAKTTIINDVKTNSERETLDIKTFDSYLEALNDLYIIEDIKAWCPKLRSKTTIRSTPIRHFVDTSIACMALNITPNDLLNDCKTFGLFFEDFVIRDLSIYAHYLNGTISHYRDSNGLECDAVIHLDNSKWAAIEIKLGGSEQIEKAIKNLRRFRNRITADKTISNPSFCMVVTAISNISVTDDGIYIVPISCLKP